MFHQFSGKSLTFQLSPEDRNLIVEHAKKIDPDLSRRLRLGVVEGKQLTFTCPIGEFVNLADAIAAEAKHATKRQLRRRFSAIHEDFLHRMEAFLASIHDPENPRLVDPHTSQFHREVQEVLERESFANLEEVNKRLQELSEAHNRRPMPDFDGLSPLEVNQLIYGDWEAHKPPLVLNRQLSWNQLERVEILTNTRLFLSALLESNGTKATSAGNLNLNFVGRMVDEMSFPPAFLEDFGSPRKQRSETYVFPLHILRVVAGLGGLIRKTKGSFYVTRKGVQMSRQDSAGELYVKLFQTFFRKFNLAYLDNGPECPGVQQTIAYSLFMFARHAGDWVSPKELAKKLFLPTVAAELPPDPYGIDYLAWISKRRILQPLERFGLAESRTPEEKRRSVTRERLFRKTDLFDAFIQFKPNG